MARTDPYMKVRWEAEQLLKELSVTSLAVDPFDIAEKLGIALKAMPANAGGPPVCCFTSTDSSASAIRPT